MKERQSAISSLMRQEGQALDLDPAERVLQSAISPPMKQEGQALDPDPAARMLQSAISSPLDLLDSSIREALLNNLWRRGNQSQAEEGRLPDD